MLRALAVTMEKNNDSSPGLLLKRWTEKKQQQRTGRKVQRQTVSPKVPSFMIHITMCVYFAQMFYHKVLSICCYRSSKNLLRNKLRG